LRENFCASNLSGGRLSILQGECIQKKTISTGHKHIALDTRVVLKEGSKKNRFGKPFGPNRKNPERKDSDRKDSKRKESDKNHSERKESESGGMGQGCPLAAQE
jgi:hypothetical protein